MQYHELQPDPLLAPYVKLIWVLELDHPQQFGGPETILPDGIVEAVFHFGEPLLRSGFFRQRAQSGHRVAQLDPLRSWTIFRASTVVSFIDPDRNPCRSTAT